MIYLKAADEETFRQALDEAGWTHTEIIDEESIISVSCFTSSHSLDIIGTIHVPNGNMISATNSDGVDYEYEETTAVDGWHANLLLHGEELPAALEPFVIEAPSTPHRKFA
jgi:hypothetical protein